MRQSLVLLAVLWASALHAAPPDSWYVKQATWVESMLATRAGLQNSPLEARLDRERVADDLFRHFWEDFAETDWFAQDAPEHQPGESEPWRDFAWYFAADRTPEAEQQHDPPGARRGGAGRRQAGLAARRTGEVGLWRAGSRLADALRRRLPPASPSPLAAARAAMPATDLHPARDDGRLALRVHRRPIRRPGRAAFCSRRQPCAWRPCATARSKSRRSSTTPTASSATPTCPTTAGACCSPGRSRIVWMTITCTSWIWTTRSIRQLTFGLGVADYEGCLSARWRDPVQLDPLRADRRLLVDRGQQPLPLRPGRPLIRRLTFDQVHDNYPTVTEDGRILYTRWEYNDRGQVYPQPLLQMNPDGTNQGGVLRRQFLVSHHDPARPQDPRHAEGGRHRHRPPLAADGQADRARPEPGAAGKRGRATGRARCGTRPRSRSTPTGRRASCFSIRIRSTSGSTWSPGIRWAGPGPIVMVRGSACTGWPATAGASGWPRTRYCRAASRSRSVREPAASVPSTSIIAAATPPATSRMSTPARD